MKNIDVYILSFILLLIFIPLFFLGIIFLSGLLLVLLFFMGFGDGLYGEMSLGNIGNINIGINITFLVPFFLIIFLFLGFIFISIYNFVNKKDKIKNNIYIYIIFVIFGIIIFYTIYFYLSNHCKNNLTRSTFCYRWLDLD